LDHPEKLKEYEHMAAPKRPSRLWTILVVLVVLALAAGGAYLAFGNRLRGAAGQASAIQTGTVTSITAVSTVADSGSVAAQQSASVFWKATGTVAEVLVQPGAHVQAGDVLMRVAPLSAPGSIIQAESDLLAA
jgi:multidrug efflux pump subunit AcrA (membrane-fusion protein)